MMAKKKGHRTTDTHIETIASWYKDRRDLLSFIKEVHRNHGYLSAKDMRDIAATWNIPVGEVYGIATFYSFLNTKQPGENVVKVCKSTPCCLNDCASVADAVQAELGIDSGETTTDDRFSLMFINCMGACDGAPAVMINNDVYQNMTPQKVKNILKNYSQDRGK